MSTLDPVWISTFCPWVIEDQGLHTRITVISYQYSNTFGQGGSRFYYRLFVRAASGELLVDEDIGLLEPNQVWQADLRDLLAHVGQSHLAAGNACLAARPADSDEVNVMRIPQFQIDYFTDRGDWEAVHSKGFNPQYWYPAEFAFARVLESATYASFLAIQNMSLEVSAQPAYVLLRSDGDRRSAVGPPLNPALNPGGSAFLAVGELFPDCAAYLGGQPGALLIEPRGSRVLPYLFIRHRQTGALSADHYTMPV